MGIQRRKSKYDTWSVEDLIDHIVQKTEFPLPEYNRELKCFESSVPDNESENAREIMKILPAVSVSKIIRCYSFKECCIELILYDEYTKKTGG